MKRPILYIFIPFALGIVVSGISNISPNYIFWSSLISFAAALTFLKKNFLSHIALFLAVLFFGIFYYQNSMLLSGDHIAHFASDNPKKLLLKGVISDDPIVSTTPYNKLKTTFVIKSEAVKDSQSWHLSRGLVDVSLYSAKEKPLVFGQRIILDGFLSKPFGLQNPHLFDYAKYLAIKDIYAVFRAKEGSELEILNDNVCDPVRSAAYRARDWMRKAINKHFEAPYSGFIKAIMIGDRTDLRYSLNSDFIKTGTVHAIAISGLNVGLIVAMLMALLTLFRLPKKINLVIAACVMVLYAFIAGSSPPIVRAVIIFTVFVAGYLINRESEMLNSLAFTALVMLLANPKELFDPSFQLSFISIAGMIIFIPKINALFKINGIKRDSLKAKVAWYTLSATAVSVAAWLATWPIVAVYFNIVSPISLAANLVVVPALFLLTAGSFLFLFAGLLYAPAAALAAHLLSLFCSALFTANHALACLPFAYVRVAAPSPIFMLLYYAVILLIAAPPKINLRIFSVRRIELWILLLLSFNILVWREALHDSSDALKITFMDVGQGDSALIELPGGRNVLIDAGPGGDDERFDAARSVIAPYLWNRNINRLDAIIVTHFHEDHLGGIIYLLENFKVGRVIDNGAACEKSAIFDRYLRTIRLNRVRRETAGEGDKIYFRDGMISVINPEKDAVKIDCNENSIVLKVEYKKFSALFCGDASGPALRRITDSYGKYLRSDVIKIPHHGGNIGDQATIKNFFDTCRAKIAIISVAKINKYRSPSQRTLNILSISDPHVYQTKDSGAVTVSVNGEEYEVKPYINNI